MHQLSQFNLTVKDIYIMTENDNVVDAEIVSESSADVNAQPQITEEQFAAYMEAYSKQHGMKCRKKGFTGHFHQPAGSKLSRKLLNQGSLYGRVSLISQTFNEMRAQAWKDSKAV